MSSQQSAPAPAGAGEVAIAANNAGSPASTIKKPVGPPPEAKESIWLRRAAIASFWAVVLLFGLPMWLRTTAVYRAALPLQQMSDWAEGQVCKPVFPLRIAVEASMPESAAQNLIQLTQHTLDNLNEFPAHSLRLLRSEAPYSHNASQQVVTNDGQSIRSDDEDVALVVRLILVETGETPRSHLQPYSPTLDVYYSPAQIPTGGRTESPLAGYIANELHTLFGEERAHLSYLLSTLPNTDTSKLKPITHEIYADHQRQSTKALKYAPTYHLTFSLFSPSAAPASWEIQSALKTYLTPLLETFSGISNFTVDSQVQLYATMSPSIHQPEYDEESKAWTLRKEDLSGFINAAEWPLSPSIGDGPTVNFILYVPDANQSPLIIKENAGNSWLVPQWGGVHILNLPAGETTPSSLSAEALAPAMQTFSNQLITLFGLPQAPASLPLRISTLERSRAASLIASTSSTLGALAQVYQKLPSIPVPDKVAQSVDISIQCLEQACSELQTGHFRRALDQARIAQGEAEKAFFEKSMVGQVYFPDEHKVAVYLPLLGPVAVPLIMAGLKELQSALKRR